MEFTLSKISRYRKEVMGACTLAIIMCHAPGNGLQFSTVIHRLLNLGTYAVDVFIFLSGVGMFFSIDRCQGNIWYWYKRRFKRILVPTLSIVIPCRIILCILNEGDIKTIPFFLTTIPFWLEHNGDWFIILILIAYLLTPILNQLLNKSQYKHIICLIAMMALYGFGNVRFNLYGNIVDQIIRNVQFVVIRLPNFVLGFSLGESVRNGKCVSVLTTFIGPIIMIACSILDVHVNDYGCMISYSLVVWLCILWNILDNIDFLDGIMCFFGEISLESYLTNVYLADIFKAIGLFSLLGGYISYLFVIIAGISLAYFVNRINRILPVFSDSN